MNIEFTDKATSKRKQEEEFMALSHGQRFERFLILSKKMKAFASKSKETDKGNFIITRSK